MKSPESPNRQKDLNNTAEEKKEKIVEENIPIINFMQKIFIKAAKRLRLPPYDSGQQEKSQVNEVEQLGELIKQALSLDNKKKKKEEVIKNIKERLLNDEIFRKEIEELKNKIGKCLDMLDEEKLLKDDTYSFRDPYLMDVLFALKNKVGEDFVKQVFDEEWFNKYRQKILAYVKFFVVNKKFIVGHNYTREFLEFYRSPSPYTSSKEGGRALNVYLGIIFEVFDFPREDIESILQLIKSIGVYKASITSKSGKKQMEHFVRKLERQLKGKKKKYKGMKA